MNIHEIIVWKRSGVRIAAYPKSNKLRWETPFYTAVRDFAIANGYDDVQFIVFMKMKVIFRHNIDKELSFALMAENSVNEEFMWKFLDCIRDDFVLEIDGNAIDDTKGPILLGKYDDMLKEIVDRRVAEAMESPVIMAPIIICDP